MARLGFFNLPAPLPLVLGCTTGGRPPPVLEYRRLVRQGGLSVTTHFRLSRAAIKDLKP